MRYSKILVHSVLLFTIPSLTLYPQADISTIAAQVHEDKTPQTHPISYDSILNLLNEIEDLDEEELERKYSQEDLKRINQFLADLAKQGILPDDAEEDLSLEDDIEELLSSEDDPHGYLFSFDYGSDYVFVPGLPYGYGEMQPCSNWFKKQWKQTKKFIKKHKKAIIIGTAVVVATVIVVCAVATASAASAAAAAAGAAAGTGKEDKDKPKADEEEPLTPSAASETSDDITAVLNGAHDEPLLTEALQDHISMFKEVVVEDNLLQEIDNAKNYSDSLGEQARNLGAILAHEALEGISELASFIPQLGEEIKEIGARILPENLLMSQDDFEITPKENYEKLITAGHEKIDQVFLTEQAERYSPEGRANDPRNKFVVGLLPPPVIVNEIAVDISKLLEAGKVLDRGGLTKAGRALAKHGYRENTAFPKPIGNPAQINKHGQEILDGLLNHPERQVTYRNNKMLGPVIDIEVPGVGGVRFSGDGERMIGFLEP